MLFTTALLAAAAVCAFKSPLPAQFTAALVYDSEDCRGQVEFAQYTKSQNCPSNKCLKETLGSRSVQYKCNQSQRQLSNLFADDVAHVLLYTSLTCNADEFVTGFSFPVGVCTRMLFEDYFVRVLSENGRIKYGTFSDEACLEERDDEVVTVNRVCNSGVFVSLN